MPEFLTDFMMPLFWLVVFVLAAIVEGMTAGLVSIWFCIGALASLFLSLAIQSFPLQLIVFCIVSLIAMIVIRPIAKKYFTPKIEATNADRVIGMQAVVIIPIDPLNATGQVKVDGKIWSAKSEVDTIIPEGSVVTVKAIQGVRLIVQPADNDINR